MQTVTRLRIVAMFVLALALIAPALTTFRQTARAEDTQQAAVDKYLPDDTSVVLMVNVKQILASPMSVKMHLVDEAQKLIKMNEHVSKITESLGFNPLKDLTSLTLALTEISAEPKGLVIIHGKFDKAKFEAKGQEHAEKAKDQLKIHTEDGQKIFEITMPDQPKPSFATVIDDSTIVASAEKSMVTDALAKSKGKTSNLNEAMKKTLEATDGSKSIWAVIPASSLSKSELVNEDKAKAMIGKLDRIDAFINFTKDIHFNVTMATKSEDNAKEISEEIKDGLNQAKGMVGFLAAQNKEMAPAVDVMNGMKVLTEGKKVVIKAELSEEVIDKLHANLEKAKAEGAQKDK
jgi:hypothetical protein